jgi:hypothetical protein
MRPRIVSRGSRATFSLWAGPGSADVPRELEAATAPIGARPLEVMTHAVALPHGETGTHLLAVSRFGRAPNGEGQGLTVAIGADGPTLALGDA